MEQPLQVYEHRIKSISRLYYSLYVYGKSNADVDISDLEQAGRIAVFDISRKRPEKLNYPGYVSAAIKYSMISEIKKMSHKQRHVYLAYQHEEEASIIDVLPTTEAASDRLDDINDLLYRIKNEFSPKEADALDSLVQGCRDVYDLNLSVPPATDTKDRVKVVTTMDLNDEEMMIYAQVLTGARIRFPRDYIQSETGKERAKKFLKATLHAKGLSTQEFAGSERKKEILQRYRLWSYVTHAYNSQVSGFLKDLDSSLNLTEMIHVRKWKGQVNEEGICELVRLLVEKLRKNPQELTAQDFRGGGLGGMITHIFKNHRSAVEFAFPGTYPQYKAKAREIREKLGSNEIKI